MGIFFAEFLGTLFLILLGNGAVANALLKQSKGHNAGWAAITCGWGFAVAFGAYLSIWTSGGHINPAVSLTFAFMGKVSWSMLPLYIFAQILGAFTGALIVYLSYFKHFKETESSEAKFLCFSTKPAIRKPFWNFLTEVIGTAVLLMGILAITNVGNQVAMGIVPLLIGLLVFAIGLSLGGPTGFAINPARDLGPRIAYCFLSLGTKEKNIWSYAWVPIVGPLVGGILGGIIYACLIRAAL